MNGLGRLAVGTWVVVMAAGVALAQAPSMTKIDPPNWWAGLPKAMLLVKGEHLDGAKFRLSDGALRVERTHVSENGHWAELWLSGSPAKPETVQVVAERGGERATMPYRFEKRRAATDGFEGFSSKDVMYLIMTDRFADGDPTNDTQPWDGPDEKSKVRGWHGGDLRGVMEHLDYLQGLGVTTVWITPVYQNHDPQSYHGYGATDMYAVDEHFGTLGDLKALADALHQRGLKLVLDTVPNHVAAGNPWVTDEPEPDWFHGTKAKHTIAQGDFGPLTDPHAAWRDRKDVTQGWFADVLPDMNQESPAVAEYLTQNAVWWEEETGADGLRIDTFPYVGREFWHGFHAELHGLYPRLTTVGEVFNPDATITSSFAGGVTRNGVDTGLDTPFDFPSYFALREVFLKGESMTKLADVLRLDALYPHPERLVPFLGNHDTTRFMGEPGATAGKMKLAFVVLTTMRGMPQIYSGDEIAMPGGGDPDNRRDFPGGFANGAPSAFVAATRRKDEAEMYDWVSGLLKVRAAHDALREGEEQLLEAKGDVLVYLRGAGLERGCGAGTDRVLVMVNNGDQAAKIAMKTGDTGLEGCRIGDVLWGGGSVGVEGGELTGEIPARQAAVVVVR